MSSPRERLTPPPRRIVERGRAVRLPAAPRLASRVDPDRVGVLLAPLRAALAGVGLHPGLRAAGDWRFGGGIAIGVDPRVAEPQGYRLSIDSAAVEVVGGDLAGLFYGIHTLAQWLTHAGRRDGDSLELPAVEIRDQPAFRHRGLLLDVSRNKVPTLRSLFELVDRMASLKLNQLQLYLEHPFAYAGHEPVWRGASPLTPHDVRRLDAYCAERFVELVPNQNSFGHLHRWLRHPAYRPLAECPEGVRHPFSDQIEPFSLCPVDPRSLDLLRDLYEQLLPNFSSTRFHVGLDETFDLGLGRSRDACRQRGKGRVYLEFLEAVRALAAEHGRNIQYWADVVLEEPERIAELPADATPVIWGYEAGHPFARGAERLAAAGLEFYLCPGTSSWISFAGRWRNALRNLAEAAQQGAATGAAGLLIADWGDLGHLQPPPASYLGLLAGAEFAWNPRSAARPLDRPWAELLDRHLFGRPGLGAVAELLGCAADAVEAPIQNGTVLGRLLLSAQDPLSHPRYERMDADGLAAAAQRIQAARTALRRLPGNGGDPRDRQELTWTAEVLALAVELGRERLTLDPDAGLDRLALAPRRRLRRRLAGLLDRLPPLWLARNRPGGLSDSLERLQRVHRMLGGRREFSAGRKARSRR